METWLLKLFFCLNSQSLHHTLHYVLHGTLVLCVFGATYCCGCIIDMSVLTLNIRLLFSYVFPRKITLSYIRVNMAQCQHQRGSRSVFWDAVMNIGVAIISLI